MTNRERIVLLRRGLKDLLAVIDENFTPEVQEDEPRVVGARDALAVTSPTSSEEKLATACEHIDALLFIIDRVNNRVLHREGDVGAFLTKNGEQIVDAQDFLAANQPSESAPAEYEARTDEPPPGESKQLARPLPEQRATAAPKSSQQEPDYPEVRDHCVLSLKHIANLTAIIDRIDEDYRDGRLYDGLTEGEREDIEAVEKFTGRHLYPPTSREEEQTTNRAHRNVSDLNTTELRDIVNQICQTLWFDFAENEFDPDKEWEVDTIEYVAGVLEDSGLKPDR